MPSIVDKRGAKPRDVSLPANQGVDVAHIDCAPIV
jgi:hypothetical protein